jgi:hypothetical protein
MTVTSFWVIQWDTTPAITEWQDDAVGGSNLNWEYGTAHKQPLRAGHRWDLNSVTGILGPVQPAPACNRSTRWVGLLP